jgi:hypothetical protein
MIYEKFHVTAAKICRSSIECRFGFLIWPGWHDRSFINHLFRYIDRCYQIFWAIAKCFSKDYLWNEGVFNVCVYPMPFSLKFLHRYRWDIGLSFGIILIDAHLKNWHTFHAASSLLISVWQSPWRFIILYSILMWYITFTCFLVEIVPPSNRLQPNTVSERRLAARAIILLEWNLSSHLQFSSTFYPTFAMHSKSDLVHSLMVQRFSGHKTLAHFCV